MTAVPGTSAISRKLVNVSMCFKALWRQIAHLELAFRVDGDAAGLACFALLAETPDGRLQARCKTIWKHGAHRGTKMRERTLQYAHEAGMEKEVLLNECGF